MTTPNWPVEPSWEVCIDQCGSKCCRTPSLFLQLKPEEEHLFDGYKIRNEMTVRDGPESATVRKIRGRFLWFQDTKGRCPHLDSQGACSIYEDRPNACHVFPFEPTPGCLVWPPAWPGALTPLPSPTPREDLPISRLSS